MEVRVGDSMDPFTNTNCGTYGSSKGKSVLEIACTSSLTGRYVFVISQSALTLCEVEVMAVPKSGK